MTNLHGGNFESNGVVVDVPKDSPQPSKGLDGIGISGLGIIRLD